MLSNSIQKNTTVELVSLETVLYKRAYNDQTIPNGIT